MTDHARVGRNSRRKGAKGEQMLTNELKNAFPEHAMTIRRGNQRRFGDDEPDNIFPGIWWESKFGKTISVEAALAQALQESEANARNNRDGEIKIPIVAARRHGNPNQPRAYLLLEDLFRLIRYGREITEIKQQEIEDGRTAYEGRGRQVLPNKFRWVLRRSKIAELRAGK